MDQDGGQGRGGRGGGCRERPADVLLCHPRDVRTGNGRIENGRIALDVGIVCPQAASHVGVAANEQLGAAEGYV
eukprot:4996585-Karenia_brevis.AAC.1